MTLKKGFMSLGLATLLASNVVAAPAKVQDVVPPEYYSELMENGMIRIIHPEEDTGKLYLLPNSVFNDKLLASCLERNPKQYPFYSENLYCLNKKDILQASGSKKDTIDISDVSVLFRAVTKMVGIKYYSNTRRREEILYKEVFMVEDPETRKPIPDPITGSSNGNTYYCIQRDASFGRCLYKLNYFENENTFFGIFNNIDRMGLGPINAVASGDMIINALIIDCGDNFVLYFQTDCNCLRFPGVKGILEKSLVARLDALKGWFMTRF